MISLDRSNNYRAIICQESYSIVAINLVMDRSDDMYKSL